MTYYLDGNNICFWKDEKSFSLAPLLNLCVELKKKGENFVCFFDANIIHLPKDKNEKAIIKDLLNDKTKFRTSPGGTKADDFIVMSANNANASIISNDWFRPLLASNPWLDLKATPQRLFKGSVFPEANGDFLMIPDLQINKQIEPNIQILLSQLNNSINQNQTNSNSKIMDNQNFEFGEPESPVTWKQLGVFVLDGSGSMELDAQMGNLPKADALNMAVKETFTRFRESSKAKSFYFSIAYFGGDAKNGMPLTNGKDLDIFGDYNPLGKVDNRDTKIGLGLDKAKDMVQEFLAKEAVENIPHSAVIVILSDGMSEVEHTKKIASELKAMYPKDKFTLCATLLEGKEYGTGTPEFEAAKSLLMEIVSHPTECFSVTCNKNTIRDFFIKSSSTNKNIG
ncbi:MAG: VWA domain-containing protein [Bacteroidetes bacterium]|nr:VWA domain-containing protein [Bacteroidota bacterium]